MQIQPNFTSKYTYSKTEEERKYNVLKDSYKGAEFLASAAGTFGVLETMDKFILTQNNKNRTAKELNKLAKKHTKINLIVGLGAGIFGYLITWPIYKKMEPLQLKLRKWADDQNRIAEKAKQLVKEENEKANNA